MAGPRDVHEIVAGYAAFLEDSPIPKLFVGGNPGSIVKEGGIEVAACRQWENQEEVEVAGIHFLQDNSPDEIGEALRRFLEGLGTGS